MCTHIHPAPGGRRPCEMVVTVPFAVFSSDFLLKSLGSPGWPCCRAIFASNLLNFRFPKGLSTKSLHQSRLFYETRLSRHCCHFVKQLLSLKYARRASQIHSQKHCSLSTVPLGLPAGLCVSQEGGDGLLLPCCRTVPRATRP